VKADLLAGRQPGSRTTGALTLAELVNDTARLKAQLGHLQQQVTNIGEGISRVTHGDPLQFGLSSIGPILAIATRLFSRRKDA